LNVLVVDDEKIQVESICRGLRSRGYRVAQAYTAEEALERIKDDGSKIEMVITDYSMPGMNGLELLKKIRETHSRLPVIMMTAYSDKKLAIAALHNRCDSFLEKPFTLDELMQETERALAKVMKYAEEEQEPELIPKHVDRISNPLMSIIGSAELAMKQLDDPDVIKSYFQRIVESAKQISRMNKEILRANNPRKDHQEPVDIERIIDVCLKMFEDLLTLNDVSVKKIMGHHSIRVLGDKSTLEQMIKNLILNAVEAMEDSNEKQLRIETDYDISDNTVKIHIADSGHGIAEDSLPTLFLPNFTTKQHGTGLGLLVVKNIVDRLKGRINVKSMLAKGTTFTVSIPAAEHPLDDRRLH